MARNRFSTAEYNRPIFYLLRQSNFFKDFKIHWLDIGVDYDRLKIRPTCYKNTIHNISYVDLFVLPAVAV